MPLICDLLCVGYTGSKFAQLGKRKTAMPDIQEIESPLLTVWVDL